MENMMKALVTIISMATGILTREKTSSKFWTPSRKFRSRRRNSLLSKQKEISMESHCDLICLRRSRRMAILTKNAYHLFRLLQTTMRAWTSTQ